MRFMQSFRTRQWIAVVSMAAASAANAELPANHWLEYYVREVPTEPASDVIFVIQLELEAVDMDGSTVGWDVAEAEFRQIGQNTDPDVVWSISNPDVDTPDGLWWVEHADPDEPVATEFATPPLLEGTADAVIETDPDLDYSVVGGTCDATCQNLFGGEVTALTFHFGWFGEGEPFIYDDDEPTEVFGFDHPPIG